MADDRRTLLAFTLSCGGALGFIAAYWTDAGTRWLAVGLTVALGGLGAGLLAWSRSVDAGDAEEPRHRLAADPDEVVALGAALEPTGALTRRRTLVLALAAAVGATGVAALTPLRSLGPRPARRGATRWAAGRRLVTSDGLPVRASSIAVDGLITAYPEGAVDDGDSAVVVLRLPQDRLSGATAAAAVDGIVGYSKVCTHAGCAVGLFQADDRPPHRIHRLLCPCHQSEFDPLDGARPVAGPAARSLPQLPLEVDADGNLTASNGFDRPVGPGFWTWP